jgi:hypothetical protein
MHDAVLQSAYLPTTLTCSVPDGVAANLVAGLAPLLHVVRKAAACMHLPQRMLREVMEVVRPAEESVTIYIDSIMTTVVKCMIMPQVYICCYASQ